VAVKVYVLGAIGGAAVVGVIILGFGLNLLMMAFGPEDHLLDGPTVLDHLGIS
jgi:hypothetical protein